MSAMRPDLRTPVMTLVDLSWQDVAGALQTLRARMEDKSAGGPCLRVRSPFLVGAKLRIQWRFEQFSGTVKYCRSDGHEYLVGIQRDAGNYPIPHPPVAETPSSQPTETVALPVADILKSEPRISEPRISETPPSLTRTGENRILSSELRRPAQRWETRANQIPPGPASEITSKAPQASAAALPSPPGIGKLTETPHPQLARRQTGGAALPRTEPPAKMIPTPTGGGKERKTMASKWLALSPWRKNKNNKNRNKNEDRLDHSLSFTGNLETAKENPMPHETLPKENNSGHSAREVPAFQVELLPVEDVYQSAGILDPRRGYSVLKVVEMLKSQHLRGLSPEMKRAAVLMALDAAGVSIDQIQRDAKLRQDALDAYEIAQKKQAEVEWARKAEETVLVRAELDSLKAHYTARIDRGIEVVERDKSRFSDWSTRKELEAKSMAEVLELCLKPAIPESTISETAGAALPLASAASLGGSGSD